MNLASLTGQQAEALVADLGWPRYRADQILAWVYQKGVRSIDEMTDLSKADRALLAERAEIDSPRIAREDTAADGTRKLLLSLSDGKTIESVLIPMDSESGRYTLCASTQVGCSLDCRFCLTGSMRMERNLKAAEIVGQYLVARRALPGAADAATEEGTRIRNIVMMGMGEPLANVPNLAAALEILCDPRACGFSPRRITVSTAGLAPGIERLGALPQKVNLAISLNAATDEVRDEIMPINRKYPIAELIAASRRYPLPPRRRITFEYVLLAGVNDDDADARRLVSLLSGVRCKVNLLAFNEFPGSAYTRPPDSRVRAFQKILLAAGLTATVRKSRGGEILAACGQLARFSEPEAILAGLQNR